MSPDKLVRMANQIAHAFAAEGEARAVPQIARHIARYWDPRMRAALDAHVAAGGEGLEPMALAACRDLAQKPVA